MPNRASPNFTTLANQQVTIVNFVVFSTIKGKVHFFQLRIIDSEPLDIAI